MRRRHYRISKRRKRLQMIAANKTKRKIYGKPMMSLKGLVAIKENLVHARLARLAKKIQKEQNG